MGGRGVALATCLGGSIALHVGLLLASTTGGAGTSTSTAPGRPSSVLARVTSAARTPAPQPGMVPAPARSTPASAASAAHTATTPDPVALAATLPDPDQDPDLAYLPRSLLTRPPAPQQSIDLLYPDLAPSGQFRAVVTLFIDDRGVVQRVRIDEADDSGLPPALEDVTRQTFLRSAFVPGEIDGRPTRSRLRIEVEYASESRRDPAPP